MDAMVADPKQAQEECIAFANAMGFAFYFWWGTRYEFRGWKSEEREATDEELEMWAALGGPHGRMFTP